MRPQDGDEEDLAREEVSFFLIRREIREQEKKGGFKKQ
jgi:hypothetical protein